ncbi:MAG: TonB-dependent receptor plug domain-containing protein [Bacteroidales bacterium]
MVVIGYGTAKRTRGSVGYSVSQKELKNLPVTGITVPQGKLAGVSVTSNSGQPSGGGVFRFFGQWVLTTINSNDPLIVIDGVPFTSNTVSSSSYDGLGRRLRANR